MTQSALRCVVPVDTELPKTMHEAVSDEGIYIPECREKCEVDLDQSEDITVEFGGEERGRQRGAEGNVDVRM
jgi:hypothetical protein